MRIAQDVINRVKYDPDLPTEAFVVGYEDRFVGIKEKAFTAFTWEVRYTRRGRTCVCVCVYVAGAAAAAAAAHLSTARTVGCTCDGVL